MVQTTGLRLQATRQSILEYLQRQGRATVKELGKVSGLTSTGIRQHLMALERDGLVQAREERGRVGRPTLVYSLTDKADLLFPKSYDLLASTLLDEIRSSVGNERLYEILRNVAQRMAAPYRQRLEGKPLPLRVKETAQIMEEQGCLIDVREKDDVFFIDEFTCPFPKVAERDRSVCVLHVDFVRILTGGDTRLVQSLMRDECACTYRVQPEPKPVG